MATLHIVVTCSNRKAQHVPADLQLGEVAGRTLAARAHRWTARLSRSPQRRLPARNMYLGEHWSVAATLPSRHTDPDAARLWVCSAGYGLISADAPIAAYSATFASGHPDSVPWQSGGLETWWRALSEWEGPQPGAPRTVTDLARLEPDATFLLVLSPPYLRACREDILSACAEIEDVNKMILISAGAGRSHGLADHIVPADARVQTAFGGSRLSMNVRVAAALIESRTLTRDAAASLVETVSAEQPPVVVHRRRQMLDSEVLAYIRGSLAENPRTSATRLLRALRDSGRACEQHRFHLLHGSVTGGSNGTSD